MIPLKLPVQQHQPKPTPLPLRNVMTIGIGVLSPDGIVVAADSQVTTDIKLWRGKMTAIVSREMTPNPDGSVVSSRQGGCTVAIAGSPSYAFRAAQLIIKTFDRDKKLVGEKLQTAFEDTLEKFHKKYLFPYTRGAPDRWPYVQLLIGAARGHEQHLWHSDGYLLAPVSFYQSIGNGLTQADPLLARFIRVPSLDLAQSALLAGIIVHHVKSVNVDCGKSTDIFCLRDNSLLYVGRNTTKAIDDACDKYEGVLLANTFREIVGALQRPDQKTLRQCRRTFRKLLDTIRYDCLHEKRRQKP
jgi:hypothetical protein